MDPMAIINISEASRGWIPASPQAGSDDLGIRTPMDSEQYSDMKGPEGRSYSNKHRIWQIQAIFGHLLASFVGPRPNLVFFAQKTQTHGSPQFVSGSQLHRSLGSFRSWFLFVSGVLVVGRCPIFFGGGEGQGNLKWEDEILKAEFSSDFWLEVDIWQDQQKVNWATKKKRPYFLLYWLLSRDPGSL